MSGLTLKKLQEVQEQMREAEIEDPSPCLVLYVNKVYTEEQFYRQFIKPELDKLTGDKGGR